MAWISGLAGKAENILNKLDQNAATALSQVPNGNETETIRKSLSSGNVMSLKTLSPAKSSKSMSGAIGTVSINTNDLLQQPSTSVSRRSSTECGAITINVDPFENSKSQNITVAQTITSELSTAELQELAAFKIALAEVTSERNELRARLLSLENEEQSSHMWSRIQELENHLHILSEEREILQHETLKLQTANSAYVHSISELESNLAKIQQEYMETAQKLQITMKQTEQQRQDFQEYRIKAQNTLQMKDNLICELKSNSKNLNSANQNTQDESHVLQLENDAVREELKNMKEERQNLQVQLEQLRQQWQEVSVENTKQLNELRDNEAALRKELRLERERKLINESEQRLTAQELYTLRHQYNQHLADAKALLQEKDQQLHHLKKAKLERATDVAAPTDAEVRLRALTQALVDKQNTVENITAERNALRIQLEKLQEEHSTFLMSSKQQQGKRNSRNTLISNSTDDAKAQFPLLMTPSPFDNRVARRVKRAYSSLDSAGVRLGAFLRRYPLMRVFLLMYVALLHIWVMFVLLSSTPN